MSKGRLALAAVLGFLWATAAAADEVSVSILAGGGVSMGSEASAAVTPMARVDVGVPVASWRMAPRLHVQLDLSALPGQAVSLEDPATFRALEFRLTLCQPIADSLYLDLCTEAGFASRLPGDPEPRDRAVRWAAGLVRFGRFGRGWLTVGVGGDQRLDGFYRPAVEVAGALKLYRADTGPLRGGSVQLLGDAVLGIDVYGTGPRRDVIRIGMAVGR
ncbi:MAG TPA: hypothetical protein VJ735_20265 [Actinomycetes bacterium]|nr:hypothetical protein [Actinomycetes bacterium]